MIYLISKHPAVEKKLREEISEVMISDDYSYENLRKLKYLEYIQK